MTKPRTGATAGRLALAVRVAALRNEGLTYKEIGARLDISRSYAAELTLDPLGEKTRARKDSYQGVCEKCGSPTSGSDGRTSAPMLCQDCSNAANHERRYYTRETIISMFREFRRATGRAPTTVDYMARSPSQRFKLSTERLAEVDSAPPLPHPHTVSREFGSWPAALIAAGLEPARSGAAGHRKRALGPGVQETLRLLGQHGPLTLPELCEFRRTTYSSQRELLRRMLRRGLITRSGHPFRHALSQPLQLNGKEQLVARTYTVLQRTDRNGGFQAVGILVEALTPDMAIEKIATEPGEYVAVPEANFVVRPVGKVERLAVIQQES